MASPPGPFITFEGLDGCGKTTQAELLANVLERHGLPVVRTREPGGTALGECIRDIVLHSSSDVKPMTEALLLAAARAQHVQEVIRPALARGEIVICERFVDSSIAYQGYGLGLSIETVREINRAATRGLVPDLTILIDWEGRQSPGEHSEGSGDRVEGRGAEFYARVREGYACIARGAPDRVMVVRRAGESPAVLHREISRIV